MGYRYCRGRRRRYGGKSYYGQSELHEENRKTRVKGFLTPYEQHEFINVSSQKGKRPS